MPNKLSDHPLLLFNNVIIEKVAHFKYLGIWLDENLSFLYHFNKVYNKISSAVEIILKLKRLLNVSLFKSLLHAYIFSVVDYCLPVWGNLHISHLNKLQGKINGLLLKYYEFQLVKKNKTDLSKLTINDALKKTNILTVKEQYDYYVLDFVFRTVKFNSVVAELNNFFQFSTRSRRQLLTVSRHYSKLIKKSIALQGAKLWNALPQEIRDINLTIPMFRFKLIELLTNSRTCIYV